MNEPLAQLFDECAAAPGALGCGLRLPDRTSRVRSFASDCPGEALEKTLLHLGGAVTLLAGHDLAGHRLAWTFAGGRLLAATRADGALFCLATRAEADPGEFFNRLVEKFLAA